jgi:hypothetical protein
MWLGPSCERCPRCLGGMRRGFGALLNGERLNHHDTTAPRYRRAYGRETDDLVSRPEVVGRGLGCQGMEKARGGMPEQRRPGGGQTTICALTPGRFHQTVDRVLAVMVGGGIFLV